MLNALQRHIMDATFDFVFSAISEQGSTELGLKALAAMTDNAVYEQNKALFTENDLLEVIDKVREIYQHECPQNRSTGYPFVRQQPEPGWIFVWRETETHGRELVSERQGLLGLVAINDNNTPPVTKEDVTNYMNSMIENCKQSLLARQAAAQPPTQAPAPPVDQVPAAAPVVNVDALFIFMQAVSGLWDSFRQALRFHPNLDTNAAATYMTTVLNIIRKGVLDAFWQNPTNFAIPSELKDFIKDYLDQHPILLEAKTYAQHTKQLEVAYLTQGNTNVNNNNNNQQMAALLSNMSTLWVSPPAAATNADIQSFTRAACDMAENLAQTLHQFEGLDPQAANNYVSNLIAAIRKNQVKEFFENPLLFGVPPELKELIAVEFDKYPILLSASTLGEQAKQVQVALGSQTLDQIRASLGDSSNNNNSHASPALRQ